MSLNETNDDGALAPRGGKPSRERSAAGHPQPRFSTSLAAGRKSTARIRHALAGLSADADPVVVEQIAVLVGALTSGNQEAEGASSTSFDLSVWVDSSAIKVELRDPEFALHRSDAGLVELDRSMLSGWRLRLTERLADRWSVAHDGELTLRFEFDGDRHLHGRGSSEATDPARDVLRSRDWRPPPIEGSRTLPMNGRSRDAGRRRRGEESPGVDL